MKEIILSKQVLAVLILTAFYTSFAQGQAKEFELCLVGGVSNSFLNFQTVEFFGGLDTYITASQENWGLGWFAGIYATHSFPRSNVFLRGQTDLNSSSIKVRYDDDHFGTIVSYTKQETARKLNFAVSLGYDLSVVRLHAGPRLGYLLTDKLNVYYFDQNLKNFNWGFGAGAGMDLFSFKLSLEYLYAQPNIGDLVTFQTKMLGFNASRHNLLISLGKSILK